MLLSFCRDRSNLTHDFFSVPGCLASKESFKDRRTKPTPAFTGISRVPVTQLPF
jgi:hypothetical protein